MNTTKHEIPGETAATPIAQYLTPERAVETMAMFGARRVLDTPPLHIGVLAAYGGALIAAGALFSVLLSAGVETPGPRRLLEGFGFSAGFFFVILSHAILFTEANVVMPVALLHCSRTGSSASRRYLPQWAGRSLISSSPCFWPVSLFDAASFQHSPANMAFFSLAAGMRNWAADGARLSAGASFRQLWGIFSAAFCS